MDNQDRINELQSQIDELRRMIYKNQFSNLYVFDEEVKFRSKLIFPKDNTVINTATVNSTGRIAIKDEEGTIRYVPYF